MAERRMFAKSIVLSDAFLDMPLSTRCLYFTLGMFADDDGFVGSPKAIMRHCGASQDDMIVLIQKRFVLAFESGVIVIKHWRLNNYLQNDRHKSTTYVEELEQLTIDEKGAYTEKNPMYTECIQNVYTDKNSIDKNSIDNTISKDMVRTTSEVAQSTQSVIDAWNDLNLSKVVKISSGSNRAIQLRKRIKDYGLENVLKAIEKIKESDFLQGKNKRGWTITFDWFILPNNFPKVLDGNYDNKKEGDNGHVEYNPKTFSIFK